MRHFTQQFFAKVPYRKSIISKQDLYEFKQKKNPTHFIKEFCALFSGGIFCFEILEIIAREVWWLIRIEFFQTFICDDAGKFFAQSRTVKNIILKELRKPVLWRVRIQGYYRPVPWTMFASEGSLSYYITQRVRQGKREERDTYQCMLQVSTCNGFQFRFHYTQYQTFGYYNEVKHAVYANKFLRNGRFRILRSGLQE